MGNAFRTKRLLLVISAIIISVLCTVCLVACGGDDKNGESRLQYSAIKDYKQNVIAYRVDGIGAEMDTDIVIPSNYKGKPVTMISNSAFSGRSDLTSVKIGNNVASIGHDAFFGCSSLTSIKIPNGVASIGDSTFYNCSSLTSIEIPNSVTSIGDSAFYNCSSLTSIEIPNGVTSIGDSAFYNCSSLTSIEIPNGVTSIGTEVFYNCSSLMSINISDSVTSIGEWAFVGTFYFNDISNWEDGSLYIGNHLIKANSNVFDFYLIKYGTITIADYAFRDGNLRSIVIPNSVTRIGDGTFYGCKSLSSIKMLDSITSIGEQAFNGCIGLISIEIPNSVTSIEEGAFYGCVMLTSVQYNGTMEQWEKISKSGWNIHSSIKAVVCTDGTIEL
ncbi:MAG: leucine-rich repeat domain-containing protein [Clostridiales bacterium]|nr:leucine-rich repeat domain-containing protein [Clostridiales bacterium]